MNIYLDIDGVLLTKGKQANHVDEFIEYLDTNFSNNIYWLTTHCKGDATPALLYLKQFIESQKTYEHLSKIKPTNWNEAKTQGIDFSVPFIWFDDNLFYNEKLDLHQNNALENIILVNLVKKPDTLLSLKNDFPIPIQ